MVGETDPNEIYIEGKPINASHEGIKSISNVLLQILLQNGVTLK